MLMNLKLAILISFNMVALLSTHAHAIDSAIDDSQQKHTNIVNGAAIDAGPIDPKEIYPGANITESKGGGDFAACFNKKIGLVYYVIDGGYREKRVSFEKSSFNGKEAILKKEKSSFNDNIPFVRDFTYYDNSGRSILGKVGYLGAGSAPYSTENFDVPESYPEQAAPGSTIVQKFRRSGGHRGSGIREMKPIGAYSYTINTVFEGFKDVELDGASKIFTSVCHFSRSGVTISKVEFFIAPAFGLIYRTAVDSKKHSVEVTWKIKITESLFATF